MMKKAFAMVLVMVLALTMSVSVFAAPGRFVNSPSGNAAPVLISFERHNEDCTAELIITPYSERYTLPEALLDLIQRAYNEIVASKDLTTLHKDLADLAAAKKIKGVDLKVSDLFDVRYEGCETHDESHTFTIVLGANTLNRFVGLMRLKPNGEWELIKNAQIVDGGKALRFTISEMSTLAIVVDTSVIDGNSPDTGDNSHTWVYLVLMLASAAAIVLLSVLGKKKT